MKILIRDIDVYTEKGLIRNGSILIDNGIILDVCNENEISNVADATVVEGHHLTAVPGYIDAHCHGGDGFDCDEGTVEAIVGMRNFHGSHGITTLFPTFAASKISDLQRGLPAIREAMAMNTPGRTEICGCHLEGPFLNKVYKGSQSEENIIQMSDEYMPLFYDNKDIIKRTTVAPEVGDNMSYISKLKDLGIQVSLGHSCATSEEIERAVSCGASSVTHLYNAMSQVKKVGPFRVCGVVEAGLTIDSLYAEIICDGNHLPAELIRIAYKSKGVDKLSVCSDASLAAGAVNGATVDMCGQTYVIENGICMNQARTSLASSMMPIDGMVRHLIFNVGLPIEDVVKMAALTTAKMLNISDRKGSIEKGKDADINLVDGDFNVVTTFCKGIAVK